MVKSSISAPFVRNPYNYDLKAVSDETGLLCEDPSLAQQQFKDESDPNFIMEHFARTRDESLLKIREGHYGDFVGINDYHSALNAVIEAEEGFMELDAKVRARFNNDPGEMLDFLADGRNYKEAVDLGLVAERPVSAQDGDLSTPTRARAPHSAGVRGGVGKSTPRSKTSESASNEDDGGAGDD